MHVLYTWYVQYTADISIQYTYIYICMYIYIYIYIYIYRPVIYRHVHLCCAANVFNNRSLRGPQDAGLSASWDLV